MTPLERLLQEEIPTGTFGGARPARTARQPAATPPQLAAAHRHELEEALDHQPTRHLHPVPDTQKDAA
jgi:hypothetical protein